MNIRRLETEREHFDALRHAETLWESPAGSAEAEALRELSTLIEAYEEKTDPIPPAGPAGQARTG